MSSNCKCPHAGCDASYVKRTKLYAHIDKKHPGTLAFKCEHCDAAFAQHLQLKKHNQAMHTTGAHGCIVAGCPLSFMQLDHMHRHVAEKHDKAYACDACAGRFQCRMDLHGHKLEMHTDIPFACDQCDSILTSADGLRNHRVRMHSSMKCPNCDATFASRNDLSTHKVEVHGNKRHDCPVCDCDYADVRKLNMHIKEKHSGSKSYKCPHCSEAFDTKTPLDDHVLQQHTASRIKCPVVGCDRSYVDNKKLYRHMRETHDNPETFACEHCNTKFSTHIELKRHVLDVHTEGRYVCKVPGCGASFTQSNNMERHMAELHGNNYNCSFCDSAFPTLAEARAHEFTIHSDLAHFNCGVDGCTMSFCTKSHLYTHWRTIHPYTPQYQCDRCDEMCLSFSNLQEHQHAVHYPKDLVCPVCGLTCDYISKYNDHYQRKHATYAERLQFSLFREETYIRKMYLAIDQTTREFQIGLSKSPISRIIQPHTNLTLVNHWLLPQNCDEHRIYAHQMYVKLLVDFIDTFGYDLVGNQLYTFVSHNTSEEFSTISNWIATRLSLLSWSTSFKYSASVSTTYVYLMYSEDDKMGKIGYTTMALKDRVYQVRSKNESDYQIISFISLDSALSVLQCMAHENDVLVAFHEQFGLVRHEYFKCADIDVAIELFNKFKSS